MTADDADTDFFENRIRPVLAQHCYNCHSQRANTLQGGLFVDSLDGLLKGGDSGPALINGKADESLLISALKHDSFKMPPKGKLADKVIDDFRMWINTGTKIPKAFKTNGAV
ncbi:MAG: c-type cytochrome domain-containing protein, partial [Planctomycetota bacterium]|nr:c-type cytochrome domain-containing protein [Planctomycetota bacterium]